jgi:predicted RNA-binding protein YlxR (DUF448 family)
VAKKAQKRFKHVPQRTCIGCRTVLSKRELIRIVKTDKGVFVDPTGKAAGRGAYVHNLRKCWEQAIKGPINSSLRMELTIQDRAKLMEFMATLPAEEGIKGIPTQSESKETGIPGTSA